MGYRASVSLGVVGAVIVAVSLAPSLAGQAQTGAANRGLTKAQQEETRKLIHDVAEGLKAKQAASELAGVPKNWKPARTPWGDPDLAGVYTNSDESGIPFEKPAEFEGRRLEDITPAELAKIQQTRREQTLERAVSLSEEPNPQLFWWETLNAKNSRVWLVQDPPDGRVPPMTAEGQQRAASARRGQTAQRARAGRLLRGSQPLRSVHLARPARIDDARHLRQLVPDSPGPGLRGDSLRDDPRNAGHSARRRAARRQGHSHLHGRCARPLGGQHARGRNDQLQGSDRVSRR